MSVYWTINGVAACRSPLTLPVTPCTSCAHTNADSPSLLRDIANLKATWPELELKIEVLEGPCPQREPSCHCTWDYDCGCSEFHLPPEVKQEMCTQAALLGARNSK